MSKLKFSLICLVLGFVLSFFTGLIGNVRFLHVILRAIIFGVLSGLFSYIAFIVLEKYLPDLFVSGTQPDVAISSEIGLDEEQVSEDVVSVGNNLNITLDDEAEDLEGVQSLEALDAEQNFDNEEFNSEDLEELSQIKETAEDLAEKTTEEMGAEEPKVLDELPNLKEFEDSEHIVGDASIKDFTEVGTGPLTGSKDIDPSAPDTDTMAKAIQTILKREP